MVQKIGSKKEHDRIVNEILLILGREAHHVCRAFNNPTGQAYRDHDWGREYIRYGVEGSGDIYGFTLNGRLFYIEVKSGNAKQQGNQARFQEMCRKFCVAYFLCRTSQDALTQVLRLAASSN